MKINLMAAGAVVPAFEVLDATHKGILDAGNSWPGYWFGKHPAATLFSSVAGGPFGMDSEDFLGWYYLAGGKELYNELLQKELKMNVVAFACFRRNPRTAGMVQEAPEGREGSSRASSSGRRARRRRSLRPWG